MRIVILAVMFGYQQPGVRLLRVQIAPESGERPGPRRRPCRDAGAGQ